MIDRAFLSVERQRSDRFMGVVFAVMACSCVAASLVLVRAGISLGLAEDIALGAGTAFLVTAVVNTALMFLWTRAVARAGARDADRD